MADFERKLRWLSERGSPVGAKELIERIEDDLAGKASVVVGKPREGTLMTKTPQPSATGQPSRTRGPAWALAAFVAVFAVGGLLYIALRGGDGDDGQVADGFIETLTDLEVIQAGVEALYSGDAERAVELFGIERDRRWFGSADGHDEAQIRDDDLIRREAAYQAAIGGRLTLDCTEEVNRPGMFTCNVTYHNALTDAVGYVDSPGDLIHVVVQDGVITQFGLPQHLDQGVAHEFPEHNVILRTVVSFLREEVEGSEGCWDDPTSIWTVIRTPECTRLIMDHLDDWAAWHESNG